MSSQTYSLKRGPIPPARRAGLTAGDRPNSADNLHVTFIAGYVAFAGIYWFPGISYDLILHAKLTLYCIFVALGFLRFKIFSFTHHILYALLITAALCAFLANSASTDFQTGVDQAINYVEPLLWLIALSGIRPSAYPLFLSRLKIALTIFVIVSIYPVAVNFGILPNSLSPYVLASATGLNYDKESVIQSASILGGGFNGGRTGWGATVSTTSLLAIALYLNKTRILTRSYVAAALILFGSTASILVTGARGGTFALLAVAAYGAGSARGYAGPKYLLVVCFVILFPLVDFPTALPNNLLRNFDVTGDLFNRLNTMTTGRLESYIGGLAHFVDSPLIGKGPIDAKVVVKGVQLVSVHNIWIRSLAESGLVGFFPLALLTTQIIALASAGRSIGEHHHSEITWPNARLAVICSLIMALVEPSVLIGSFNANAAAWTAIWLAVAKPIMNRRTLTAQGQFRNEGNLPTW